MKDFKTVRLKDLYGAMLTDRQRDVIELYYEFDLSLGEIAENLSVTRQAVHCALKQAEGILENLEQKLGFLQKTSELTELVQSYKNTASNDSAKDSFERILEKLRS